MAESRWDSRREFGQRATFGFPNETNVAGATSLPPSCLRVKHPTIPSHETGPLARCPIRYSWLERMCRACSPPVPLLSPPPRPVAWAISFCAVGAASPAIGWRGKSVNSLRLPSREIGQCPSARAFPHSRPSASVRGPPPPCLRVRLPPSRHGTGAEMTCRPGGSSNASPPFSGLRCFTPARAANGLPPQVTGDPVLVGMSTRAVVFGGISNS